MSNNVKRAKAGTRSLKSDARRSKKQNIVSPGSVNSWKEGQATTKPRTPANSSISSVKHYHRFEEDERDANSSEYVFQGGFKFAPIFSNVAKMLRERGQKFDLKYDEFSQKALCCGEELKDQHIRLITDWVQRLRCLASQNVVADAIAYVAEENAFHPVKDYLDSLEWDGASRVDTFFIDLAGTTDSALNRAITARWLIQAVARIYRPGCQADATLILEGTQGLGKSTLLRTLFGSDWFTDHLPDIESKDAKLQLRGKWGIELAELATLSKSETASIKAFLTSVADDFRKPYERTTVNIPRSCVFAGTVNPGAMGYLKDETGGRRFWPIEVTKKIDFDAIKKLRDQIWAEAVVRFKRGEIWHLNEPHLIQAVQALQADRYVGDPWLPVIEEYISEWNYVTLNELLGEALKLDNVGKWGLADSRRASQCLSHLGWVRYQARTAHGRTEYRFRRRGTSLPPSKEKEVRLVQPSADCLDPEFFISQQQGDEGTHRATQLIHEEHDAALQEDKEREKAQREAKKALKRAGDKRFKRLRPKEPL